MRDRPAVDRAGVASGVRALSWTVLSRSRWQRLAPHAAHLAPGPHLSEAVWVSGL